MPNSIGTAPLFSFLIFLDKIFPALNNHDDIIRTDFSEESGKCGEGKERARRYTNNRLFLLLSCAMFCTIMFRRCFI